MYRKIKNRKEIVWMMTCNKLLSPARHCIYTITWLLWGGIRYCGIGTLMSKCTCVQDWTSTQYWYWFWFIRRTNCFQSVFLSLLCEHFEEVFAVTLQQRPQGLSPDFQLCHRKMNHLSLDTVDSLICWQFSYHKAQEMCFPILWELSFLCAIKLILSKGKLLRSRMIRTNDRCCKQAECFNSDVSHWFASAANYFVGWGYSLFQSSRRDFSHLSIVLFCSWKFLIRLYY